MLREGAEQLFCAFWSLCHRHFDSVMSTDDGKWQREAANGRGENEILQLYFTEFYMIRNDVLHAHKPIEAMIRLQLFQNGHKASLTWKLCYIQGHLLPVDCYNSSNIYQKAQCALYEPNVFYCATWRMRLHVLYANNAHYCLQYVVHKTALKKSSSLTPYSSDDSELPSSMGGSPLAYDYIALKEQPTK